MNSKKGWITTTCLTTVLALSTATVNAGTIIGGRSLCSESGTTKVEDYKGALGGTIIGGLTGTIIGGLTGTIIGGLTGTIIGGVTDFPSCQE